MNKALYEKLAKLVGSRVKFYDVTAAKMAEGMLEEVAEHSPWVTVAGKYVHVDSLTSYEVYVFSRARGSIGIEDEMTVTTNIDAFLRENPDREPISVFTDRKDAERYSLDLTMRRIGIIK